jgi:hypothetical protein
MPEDVLQGLSAHDLLVQLVREREADLMSETSDWGLDQHGDERRYDYKVLDADAVASLIEEVLDGVGARLGK